VGCFWKRVCVQNDDFTACRALAYVVSKGVGPEVGDLDWKNLAVLVRRSVVAGHPEDTTTEASKKPVTVNASLATALLQWQRWPTMSPSQTSSLRERLGKPAGRG
jgi:hypothetical protein